MMVPTCILVVFSVVSLVSADQPDAAKCHNLSQEIDFIVKEVIMSKDHFIIPSTEERLKEWCTITKPITKKIKEYVPCQAPYPKQIIQLLAGQVKKSIQYMCHDKRYDTIRNYACLSPEIVAKLREITRKELYLISQLKNEDTTSDGIVSRVCCTFATSLDSIKSIPKNNEGKCATEDSMIWLHDRMKSSIDDILDFMCSDLQSTEKCKARSELSDFLQQTAPPDFDVQETPFLASVLEALKRLTVN